MNQLMQPLGINIQAGTSFGWGIVGLNLALEFCRGGRVHPILTLPPGELDLDPSTQLTFDKAEKGWDSILCFNEKFPGQPFIVDFPVLYCGGNQFQHRLSVGTSVSSYSITVFENSNLGAHNPQEKSFFKKILAGSRWNARILEAQGFENVEVWNQGVDTALFSPEGDEYTDDGVFRVFSGGKLEFRKGQDLVIAAFRRFRELHNDAVLVTAWHSPWMDLASSFVRSRWVSPPVKQNDGYINVSQWLNAEGIPPHSVLDLGALPNREMPAAIRQCDVALFPSRAEGATNLVAMETIACGVPTIVSANTGHLDLLNDIPALQFQQQYSVPSSHLNDGTEGWGESDVEEMVQVLEDVYQNRDDSRKQAKEAVSAIQTRNWNHRTAALEEACFGKA